LQLLRMWKALDLSTIFCQINNFIFIYILFILRNYEKDATKIKTS
jgi:hypothetical protein